MKFTIQRDALLKPLQVVSGVVERRQTLPILSNLLVQTTSEGLTLTGTDLEVELTASVELKGADAGEITLPARKFVDICRTLPDGAMIEVEVREGRAVVRSGKSRFALATLPATEFPATEGVTKGYEFTVSQRGLKTLIEQTQFCMANQDVRYYLNGLLLEIGEGKLRTVATDGHRLALSELQGAEVGLGESHQVIIPRKGVVELGRLLGDGDEACTVQGNDNHIRVSLNGVTLISKLIDGRFPDYERVMPEAGNKKVVADREVLRQALVRTSILSNEKYRGIRLQVAEGSLRAVVNNPEQEEAEEEIEVQYQGEEFEIGFNVSYLLEALNAVRQAEVEIMMTDANSSCRIQGMGDDTSRYVVMPMRL